MSPSSAGLRVRLARKTQETAEICSFELHPVQGASLPAFAAGSHIDVQLTGAGGASLTRQYSLCNDPAERHRYLIAVLLDAHTRGGSQAMHALQVGDELTISAPKNHFALAPTARHSLLLAGGIGVTPILCMAQSLAQAGANFQMHYCTRSKDRTAFFERISASGFAHQVHFHFDNGHEARRLPLAALLATRLPDAHLYVCGPKGYIDAVLKAARAAGWPEHSLHHEFFSAAPALSETDDGFAIRLASTGQLVQVPKDQTVVQALAAVGVAVPTSCEQGLCGTCLTGVLEGVPEHRDMFLTPAEQRTNTQFLPCCSRSKTPLLVLDL